jgi:hypothetical protein
MVGVRVGVLVFVGDGLGVTVLVMGWAVGEFVGEALSCLHPIKRKISTNPVSMCLIILPPNINQSAIIPRSALFANSLLAFHYLRNSTDLPYNDYNLE